MNLCPNCGSAIPADTQEGVCPKCMAKAAELSQNPTIRTAPPKKTIALDISCLVDVSPTIKYFGDYELLKEVARGGMGVVYKARQKSLNRIVAVKMILAGQLAGEREIKRFQTEAEAAANLQHPNIVAIHEIGQHDGQHYFSMDFVTGRNLSALVRDGPIPAREAATLVQAIAEAIHYAHQRGTLHRDLKPQNILIDADGTPRITDFGLAKLTKVDSSMTQTGAVMGSPSYMPPEQAAGRQDQVGPASDVYSIGAILYELLTGRPPFRAETPIATLQQVLNDDPVRPSKLNPSVPPDLETICLKCLEKKSERRYPTARALAEELERFLNENPILARPAGAMRKAWTWMIKRPWVVTGLASAVTLALLGFALRLFEKVKLLEWEKAHPRQTHPFNGTDHFFPHSLVIPLVLEFFIQGLPLAGLLEARRKGTLGGRTMLGFTLLSVAQLGLGVFLLNRTMSAGVWDQSFSGEQTFIASLAALSNSWFGAVGLWLVIRENRAQSAGRTKSAEPHRTMSENPAPKALILLIIAEMGLFCFVSRPPLDQLILAAFFTLLAILHCKVTASAFQRKNISYLGMSLIIIPAVFAIRFLQKPFPDLILFTCSIALLLVTASAISVQGAFQATTTLPFLVILGYFCAPRRAGLELDTHRFWQGLLAGLLCGALAIKISRLRQPDPNSLSSVLRRYISGQWFQEVIRKKAFKWSAISITLVFLSTGGSLMYQHFSTKRALRLLKADLAAKGALPNPALAWPQFSSDVAVFSNRFLKVTGQLTNCNYVGSLTGMLVAGPGQARVSWKVERLPFAFNTVAPVPWSALDLPLQAVATPMRELKELMNKPPRTQGIGSPKGMGFQLQSLVPNRIAAQWLSAAALNALHNRNLGIANRNLIALAGVSRLYQDDPSLVNQMVRNAIVGLAVPAIWEALQSPDWNEGQLAELQNAWEKVHVLDDILKAYQTERAVKCAGYETLRSSSNNGASDKGFLFRCLWKFAWSYSEELDYLKYTEGELAAISGGVTRQSLMETEKILREHKENYRPPMFPQRFYYSLTLFDNETDSISAAPVPASSYNPFSKAFLKAMQNLTEHQMCLAAIALRRYHLRYAKLPISLSALRPEFLKAVPVDLMDGKPLRYRANMDGTFVLYSIGRDGKDDGGDPNPQKKSRMTEGLWEGRDAVWPTPVN